MALELEARRKIYQTVLAHPGLHLRELQRITGMAIGMLTYHLDVLEKSGFIRSEIKEKRKCYFPYKFSYADSNLLLFMREQVPRQILLLLLEKPRKFQEIVSATSKSKSVVSTHLRRMQEAGIVAVEREERESVYKIREPDKVVRLFITYRKSFYDDALDRFIELYLEI